MQNWIALTIALVPTALVGWFWMQASKRARAAESELAPIQNARTEAERIRAAAKREAEAQRAQSTSAAERVRAAANADAAAARKEAEQFSAHLLDSARSAVAAANDERTQLLASMHQLRTEYSAGLEKYQEMSAEIKSLEEDLELVDVGLYTPHFTYEDSEAYKYAIEGVDFQIKTLVKSGLAVFGPTTFYVNGDSKAGAKMVKHQQKLLLRAFNAEAEAALANVTWSNYATMQKRIEKACLALNELGKSMNTGITPDYLKLRLKELRLVHEAAEKRQQEKEEQRLRRAAEREEEKVQRELAKAKDAAEREEEKYNKALERARAELEESVAEERDSMAAKIAELEAKVAEAHERKERAIAQAQLTKVGHVYIISNHGAFGEGVVKIGMTRRLEPEERIQELGDASVPFPFDLHALIYSEDAPALEAKLHDHFWDHRINWANNRKEFFRVDLQSLQQRLRELGLKTELHMIPEAREYRETIAALAARSNPETAPAPTARPKFARDPFAKDDE